MRPQNVDNTSDLILYLPGGGLLVYTTVYGSCLHKTNKLYITMHVFLLLCWLCSALCEELFHPWLRGAVCPAPSRRGRHHPAPGRYKKGGHPGEAAATTNYIADS